MQNARRLKVSQCTPLHENLHKTYIWSSCMHHIASLSDCPISACCFRKHPFCVSYHTDPYLGRSLSILSPLLRKSAPLAVIATAHVLVSFGPWSVSAPGMRARRRLDVLSAPAMSKPLPLLLSELVLLLLFSSLYSRCACAEGPESAGLQPFCHTPIPC